MKKLPQYEMLYNRLKREILADVYPVDSILPSENDLCSVHNVARSTVRQALSRLESEGFIQKQKGKGSIVKSKRRTLNLLSFHGFSESVREGKIETLSVQVPKLQAWPEGFPFELSELEGGAGCAVFSRVRLMESHPVMWEITYLPNLNLPKFTKQYRVEQSFFEFLGKNYQVEIVGMEQELWAIAAPPDAAQYLQVSEGNPILKIHRKYHTNREHLFIYSILYCTTDKFAMSNRE